MSAASDASRVLPLVRTVEEEAAALSGFIDLLERESRILKGAEMDALPGLAEEKNRILQHLSALAARRNTLLAEMGLGPDKAGMEAWLAGAKDAAGARRHWQQLLDRTAQAREINRLNGALISARLQHNQKALQVLLGAADQAAALYGPDGQALSARGGRSLGSG